MKRPSLGASAFWRLLEGAGSEVLSFLGFVALARVLVPEHFGAVALAGTVLQLIQVVLYNGSLESMIQHPNLEPRHFHAACRANFKWALVLVSVGLVLAWPLAYALRRPEFAWLLCALLPSALLRSFMSPMLAVLRRDMNFRAIALRTLLAVTIASVVAVFCARHGWGAWSLVAQQWTNEVVGIAFLWWQSPLKPMSDKGDKKALDELLPVALPVMGAQFVSNASRKLDNFAVGMRLGDHVVGVYFMANRLVGAAQAMVLYGLGEVAMVVMSRALASGVESWAAVSSVLRLAAWPSFLVLGTLALLGPLIVPILFGPVWMEATHPMAVLAAFAPAGAMISMIGVALVARGEATAYRRMSVAVAVLQLAAIVAAAHWGIDAIVLAIGAAQVVSLPYAFAHLRRAESRSWAVVLKRVASLLLVHVVIFTPCAVLSWLRPDLAWAAGIAFPLVAGVVGWVQLKSDWVRVNAPPAAQAS